MHSNWNTFHLPKTYCPVCNRKLDAATGDGTTPEPEDLSVCLYCGSFLRYNTDLTLRLMTEEEVIDLPDDTRIILQNHRRLIEKLKENEHC